MIVDALQLAGANVCFLAAGFGMLALAGWPVRLSRLRPLGLSYLAGAAAVGTLAPLLLLAGLSLSALEVVAVCALIAVAGIARVRLAGAPEPLPSIPSGSLRLVYASVGLVAAFFLVIGIDLWYQPLFAWDAWQHWTAKARSLVLLDGLDASMFSAPAYIWWNADYPLLLPSLEAIDFRFMGMNTRILHLQFGLLLLGLVLALAELTRDRVPRAVLWPFLVALVWAPSLAIQTASAYADVPLAIFFACAGLCAWRWLDDGETASLTLLALFAAASLATKMEGQILVAALLVVLLALAARRSWTLARRAALAGAGAFAVGIVPWRLWTSAHDVVGVYSTGTLLRRLVDPDLLGASPERVGLALVYLGRVTLDPTSWLLLVPLALAASVLMLVRSGAADGPLLMLGTLGLAFLGLVAVYWLTPYPLEWHLDRSAWRVVTGLVVFAGALTAPMLAGARRHGTSR